METDDAKLFKQWIVLAGLVDFEVIPVVNSTEKESRPVTSSNRCG
jgi:hypothetical protein